ncbi:hypothetical protein NDU88_006922 [Pleurodeles waltl]|uniref:Uncharacterized protein n=1 Tax=Pleurodeles waltl TaxID=8319 RepID=A0AAV7N4W3_PLEWA|nr:hypothetical protein NDU88_006922 [Pleurodeles waltl]
MRRWSLKFTRQHGAWAHDCIRGLALGCGRARRRGKEATGREGAGPWAWPYQTVREQGAVVPAGEVAPSRGVADGVAERGRPREQTGADPGERLRPLQRPLRVSGGGADRPACPEAGGSSGRRRHHPAVGAGNARREGG